MIVQVHTARQLASELAHQPPHTNKSPLAARDDLYCISLDNQRHRRASSYTNLDSSVTRRCCRLGERVPEPSPPSPRSSGSDPWWEPSSVPSSTTTCCSPPQRACRSAWRCSRAWSRTLTGRNAKCGGGSRWSCTLRRACRAAARPERPGSAAQRSAAGRRLVPSLLLARRRFPVQGS